MMSGEHISRDDLVDMFATFSEGVRNNILMELNNAISETEAEAQDGAVPANLASESLRKLNVIQACLLQASSEFKGLSKR